MDASLTLVYVGIFGLVLGWVVGMTSIGKGLIGTPGLILLGIPGPTAVGTIGFAGVFMMISSAIKHYRNKNVDIPTVIALSISAVPLSYVFASYKDQINEQIRLTNIIAGAIVLSVITLAYKFFVSKSEPVEFKSSRRNFILTVIMGIVLGFFIGVTSISGSLIVIAFMLFLRMPEKLSIGTTNFVAIFSLAAASVAHLSHSHIDWAVFATLTPTVILGAYLGAHMTDRMPKKVLRIIILALLLVAAVGIIFKNGAQGSMHDENAQKEKP